MLNSKTPEQVYLPTMHPHPSTTTKTSTHHDISTSVNTPQSNSTSQQQTSSKINTTLSTNIPDTTIAQSSATKSLSNSMLTTTVKTTSPATVDLKSVNSSTNQSNHQESSVSSLDLKQKSITTDLTSTSPKRSSPDHADVINDNTEKAKSPSKEPPLKKVRSSQQSDSEPNEPDLNHDTTKEASTSLSSNSIPTPMSVDSTQKESGQNENLKDKSEIGKHVNKADSIGSTNEGTPTSNSETVEDKQQSNLETKKSPNTDSSTNSLQIIPPGNTTSLNVQPEEGHKTDIGTCEVESQENNGSVKPSEQTIAPMEIDKSSIEENKKLDPDTKTKDKSETPNTTQANHSDTNNTKKRTDLSNETDSSTKENMKTLDAEKQKITEKQDISTKESTGNQSDVVVPHADPGAENTPSNTKRLLSSVTAKSGGSVPPTTTFSLRSTPVHAAPPSSVKSQQARNILTSLSGSIEPTLRSQPVPNMTKAAQGQDQAENNATGDVDAQKPTKKREKRKISWAPEEKLVEVQYIDTRLELIRSWDPEFDITLPFAPNTLQMLKGVIQEQDARETGKADNDKGNSSTQSGRIQLPLQTSFEEARKREHDMELERAQQAKMKIKEKLNNMLPKRRWKQLVEVVLPAECRMDDTKLEEFSIMEGAHQAVPPHEGTKRDSPSSPPPEYQRATMDEDAVRFFPLSSDDGDTSENGSSYFATSAHIVDNAQYGTPQGTVNGSYLNNSGSLRHDGINAGDQHGTNRQGQGNLGPDRRQQGYMHPMASGMPVQTVQQMLSALKSSGVFNLPGNGLSKPQQHGDGQVDKEGQGDENYENGDGRQYGNDTSEQYNDNDGVDRQTNDGSMMTGPTTGGLPVNPNMPPNMMGHPGFPPQGMDNTGMPFAMPPIPPGSLDMLQNMMHLHMGVPVPLGMPIMPMPIGPNGVPGVPPIPPQPPANKSHQGNNRGRNNGKGGGRAVETISRPKSKPAKQRKKCKYFGTKQGCRDGNACMYLH